MSGGRVLVMGTLGGAPFAGIAWQVLHYLEGLRRLGYDVHYVEDTAAWPYDPERNAITDDCGYATRYIDRLTRWCGLGGRWAYRAPDGAVYGYAEGELDALVRDADALVNLTGATVLTERYLGVPVRIYLETDPVMPQIEVAQGREFTIDMLAAHTHHFSYGENLGADDCGVPVERFRYEPTRQPVVLDWWRPGPGWEAPRANGRLTTVASWEQHGKDIAWRGETYLWSKHHEFLKLLDLPRRTSQPLELALACDDDAVLKMLAEHGWGVTDALTLSRDVFPYRDYIVGSHGEFTVAKDQNIRLRSGWFSDRSACYLAAGRPVITQDTGFPNVLPTGRGLFAFRDADDVLRAIAEIEADYEGHSRAAREIADEWFAAERVLGSMMERAGLR